MASQSTSGQGKYGTLLHSTHLKKSGRTFFTWKPNNLYKYNLSSMVNSSRCYTKLVNLSHVEHFQDYKISQENRRFSPNQLSYLSNSHLSKSHAHLKVVWFGPRQDKRKHNFYGNVSYTV
ncbi:unnamed protein product, partial [Meganyctiphanes norvegica]